MLISPECEICHCFGAHQLIHNLKANIFILKAKKTNKKPLHFYFRGPWSLQ